MANNLKTSIEFIGLSYKKEITKILAIDFVLLVASVAGFFYMKNYLIIAAGLGLIGIIDYLFYYTYSSKKFLIIKDHSDEFVHIISYFRIFIQNKNNVYQSFNRVIQYSSDWMKENLQIMLTAIDSDKSIKPFTDFADKFDFPIARNVMISIYQMVEEGEVSEQLNQFTVLFEQMNKTLYEERKDRKTRSFDVISFFPTIGAGIITIALTFSMLTIVGDMVNVI